MYQSLITLFFLIILYGFGNQSIGESIDLKDEITNDTAQNPLALYGAQIFNDNKCLKCHKLITTGKKRLKSLDGLGGKFPDIWLYSFLHDPESLVPKTRMPSFDALFKKELNKNRLKKILQQSSQGYSTEQLELSWQLLNEEVTELKAKLQLETHTEIISSEGLALLSFLQRIPQTKSEP